MQINFWIKTGFLQEKCYQNWPEKKKAYLNVSNSRLLDKIKALFSRNKCFL